MRKSITITAILASSSLLANPNQSVKIDSSAAISGAKNLFSYKSDDIVNQKVNLDKFWKAQTTAESAIRKVLKGEQTNYKSNYNDLIRKDLGADSLDTIEVVMECEKILNISIADEDYDYYITVGDLIKVIYNNLNK